MRPTCFVIMPFGEKESIDFDKVYKEIIVPSCKKADVEVIRADEELMGGIIHKSMFERIILSDIVIVDVSIANANVYYELGIRHALKKSKTILIAKKGQSLEFDIRPMRTLFYDENSSSVKKIVKSIQDVLKESYTDSPIYNFFDTLDEKKLKDRSETFQKNILKENEIIQKIDIASDLRELNKIKKGLQFTINEEQILLKLFLKYKDCKFYEDVLKIYKKLPKELQEYKVVKEQLGFCYNRIEKRDKAKIVLKDVIKKYGQNSETLGILGRVYKDEFLQTNKYADLKKAINYYKQGFESDIRDYYPGINLVTLMSLDDKKNQHEFEMILNTVKYSIKQDTKKHKNYWNVASLLELEVLSKNKKESKKVVQELLEFDSQEWMIETTVNNLQIINNNYNLRWIGKIMKAIL